MNKEDKATRCVHDKMFPHILNATRMNEQPCFTSEDLREAYLQGWDEALKIQWIMVDERKPQENEKVFVLFEYNGMVRIDTDVYFGDNHYMYYTDGVWSFGGEKIIAWMPIPSFEKILEANKDVLKRLKSK